MIVFIAGPYRGDVGKNISNARAVAMKVWEKGHVALCPHLNTAFFDETCACKDADYLAGDLKLLARCDAMVMIPKWEKSEGASKEVGYALAHDIPVYYYPDIPPLHPTEQTRPNQVEAFINTVMSMYRVHLQKNADYSPANILGTGEVGLVTRLWDKIARLMNLTGFHINITSTYFTAPEKPKNESIDDTLMDAATYSVIGLLLRKGVWGK